MENIQTTDKNAKEIVDFAKQNLIEKLKASGWADFLKTFLHSSNFDDIIYKLWDAKNQGQRFTPQLKDVFRAFEECPYSGRGWARSLDLSLTKESAFFCGKL